MLDLHPLGLTHAVPQPGAAVHVEPQEARFAQAVAVVVPTKTWLMNLYLRDLRSTTVTIPTPQLCPCTRHLFSRLFSHVSSPLFLSSSTIPTRLVFPHLSSLLSHLRCSLSLLPSSLPFTSAAYLQRYRPRKRAASLPLLPLLLLPPKLPPLRQALRPFLAACRTRRQAAVLGPGRCS